jgi:hypothetical protein
MIDDGTPKGGTTNISAHRAMKGWGTCREDLWASNVDLDVSEFEDWRKIPNEAWDDARQKRIQNNRRMAGSCPSEALDIDGQVFRLFVFVNDLSRIFGGEDRQFELLVIDSDFDTIAWSTLRAVVKRDQIILEDLFVKPNSRRMHIGTTLLQRIERIACLEKPFSELKHEIKAPISKPDAGPTRYVAVRDFFMKNGYDWNNTDQIRKYLDWSIFTAIKKLDCGDRIKRQRQIQ